MPSIFAPEDLVTLLSDFPPPVSSKAHPSCIFNRSKQKLFNPNKVVANFRKLIDCETQRIRLADLPSILGVDGLEWPFDRYGEDVAISGDGQFLIPIPLQSAIVHDFDGDAPQAYVDVSGFASDHDIATDSLKLVVNRNHQDHTYLSLRIANGREVIAHKGLVEKHRRQLTELLSDTGAQKVDLTSSHPDIPADVLKELAEQVVKEQAQLDGSIELANSSVYFVPQSYLAEAERQAQSQRADRLAERCRSLHDRGYCVVDRIDTTSILGSEADTAVDQLCTIICNKYSADFSDEVVILSSQTAKVIARKEIVDENIEQFKQNVSMLFDNQSPEAVPPDELSEDVDFARKGFIGYNSNPVLVDTLLQAPTYHQELAQTYKNARSLVVQAEITKFGNGFRRTIMAPLQLHSNGVRNVSDSTLQEHMQEYLGDHFRREMIPQNMEILKTPLLRTQKAFQRDTEKFLQSCSEAKAFSEIEAAVSRFARKQKVEAPSEELLTQVQHSTMQQRSKAIQRMDRGSDVLQNLVWILLCRGRLALFMSSGKDTSRMIKQCQAIGDEERLKRLHAWRDLLKADKMVDQDLEDMKQMARDAVASG